MFLIANALVAVVIVAYCKGYRSLAEKHFGRTILIPVDAQQAHGELSSSSLYSHSDDINLGREKDTRN